MDKTRIVFGIGIVLAVLVVLTAPAAAQNWGYYHLVPEDSSCSEAGCTTTVWVMLNHTGPGGDYAVDGGVAIVDFDHAVVNITNVEEGTDPNWVWWTWWSRVDSETGQHYVKIKFGNLGMAPQVGEIQLGKMTLHCESPGVSPLEFGHHPPDDILEIVDQAGDIVTENYTVQNGTFTCMAPQETFSKDLVKGWNLISLPLYNATNMTVANIMSSVSGSYDALYRYDASAHGWVPLSSSDTMANGVGYFIHMTSADTWTYSGSAYTDMDISLQQGLNMIGWLNCSKPIDDALSSIDGDYWYVARWNATSQSYETYNPVAPSVFNDFTTLERGEGYFISMNNTGDTLSESCSA